MNRVTSVICMALAVPAAGCAQKAPLPDDIARGRFLVSIGGCNDCHTAGYAQKAGEVPESQWLTGDSIGYRGPWGTTYPANLRLLAQRLTEDEWIPYLRAPRMPPMPWFNLVKLSDDDLRAMYRFIHGLGSAGKAAPAYVAPDGQVTTPYIEFVPKTG